MGHHHPTVPLCDRHRPLHQVQTWTNISKVYRWLGYQGEHPIRQHIRQGEPLLHPVPGRSRGSPWCKAAEIVQEISDTALGRVSTMIPDLEEINLERCEYAGEGIRTLELLQDWTLNPAPLTWLGNPRVHICRCRENYTCSPAAGRAPVRGSSAVGLPPGSPPDGWRMHYPYPAPPRACFENSAWLRDPAIAAQNSPENTRGKIYCI